MTKLERHLEDGCQPKSIAGYGDPVIVKGDGLWLYNVEWTKLGEENARNYKDLSPARKTIEWVYSG
jgi:hypothetical protein